MQDEPYRCPDTLDMFEDQKTELDEWIELINSDNEQKIPDEEHRRQ